MDEAIVAFRRAAAGENRGRVALRRRYSPTLQQQAADYWRRREVAGDGVNDVARALGVAPWSLRRWARDPRLRPVQVVPDAGRATGRVVIVVRADGVYIEGVELEAVASVVSRLR
jgi:hypothetical protein